MGNTVPGRRNSILSKEGSVSETSRQNTISESETIVQGVQPDPLTPEQMELLIKTWKLLEDDIAHVGVITFISLFETHPDVQQGFMSFSGIELEDLKHSKQLRAHALRLVDCDSLFYRGFPQDRRDGRIKRSQTEYRSTVHISHFQSNHLQLQINQNALLHHPRRSRRPHRSCRRGTAGKTAFYGGSESHAVPRRPQGERQGESGRLGQPRRQLEGGRLRPTRQREVRGDEPQRHPRRDLHHWQVLSPVSQFVHHE